MTRSRGTLVMALPSLQTPFSAGSLRETVAAMLPAEPAPSYNDTGTSKAAPG